MITRIEGGIAVNPAPVPEWRPNRIVHVIDTRHGQPEAPTAVGRPSVEELNNAHLTPLGRKQARQVGLALGKEIAEKQTEKRVVILQHDSGYPRTKESKAEQLRVLKKAAKKQSWEGVELHDRGTNELSDTTKDTLNPLLVGSLIVDKAWALNKWQTMTAEKRAEENLPLRLPQEVAEDLDEPTENIERALRKLELARKIWAMQQSRNLTADEIMDELEGATKLPLYKKNKEVPTETYYIRNGHEVTVYALRNKGKHPKEKPEQIPPGFSFRTTIDLRKKNGTIFTSERHPDK